MPARHLALALPFALAAIPAPAAQPEVAPPPRAVVPEFDIADWTPRPAVGKAEPWERATDKDWVDARFRAMNTGPALNCTMRYPLGKGQETVYKATVVKLGDKGDAGAVFDRATMRLAAAWTGGYLNHSDRRFGLLNTPTPKGEMVFSMPGGLGWTTPDAAAEPFVETPAGVIRHGNWATKGTATAPAAPDRLRYKGASVVGDRVTLRYAVGDREVSETPSMLTLGGVSCLVRSFEVGPGKGDVWMAGGHFPEAETWRYKSSGSVQMLTRGRTGFAVVPGRSGVKWADDGDTRLLLVEARDEPVAFQSAHWIAPEEKRDGVFEALGRFPEPTALGAAKPGPKRWGEPIVTGLVCGEENGAFAVDTLTIPYKNRFNALFFCTGLDFLPRGGNPPRVPPEPPSRQDRRIAVCTCHGDVWLVTVDEKARTCSWQRFATGLYHPLGLKVIDGKVVVLERGQLTRLHDLNDDGEADFYECVCNDWDTGAGEHSYDTCLETDPQGNFYFFKTGDTHLPTGGCLMRVSKDGSKAEVFATGFRHPIGMGMSPTGILIGADQEGNWMPATRIDEYRQGGFYGDFSGHHRKEPPKTFDPPLCWLPREVDNSAGGQVWVPARESGVSATGGWANSPLDGLPLHLSYGRCRPFVLLRQECGGGLVQGGVAALDVKFLSGVCRGRFGPDGHLYVCGLNGWQTAAQADGCLQRVRYTGKPLDVPVKMAVEGNALRLTFSRPLDAKSVADAENYKAAWWNYRWSADYGSKRWKVSDPKAEGQDEFGPRSAKRLADGRTVEMVFEKLQPVMQMQVGYNLSATDGRKVVGSVFLTIHSTGK